MSIKSTLHIAIIIFFVGLATSCSSDSETGMESYPEFDPNNGGLELPEGFQAYIVADSVTGARHLTVNSNGDIYVATRSTPNRVGGTVGLRDTDGDGRADQRISFGDIGGTGIEIQDGYLYAATDTSVVRFSLNGDNLNPDSEYEIIVEDLPVQQSHAAKSMALDGNGNLFVNIGAPSNSCMEQSRTPGSQGMDPCPLLEETGGIWRFSDSEQNQGQSDGQRYATGIRNAVALDWNSDDSNLYMVQHGRDQLDALWPELFDAEDNSQRTAEEFVRLEEGEERPWPYCFYDLENDQYVLSPEYGGDGETTGRCESYSPPLAAYPAHHAPNDLLFYQGDQFPEEYENGAFIAFHGSWNRAGGQGGYRVVFQPMSGGDLAGEWSVFADNFAGSETIQTPNEADFRPVGLAIGPDGSLYISDSVVGRIWRVMYTGN